MLIKLQFIDNLIQLCSIDLNLKGEVVACSPMRVEEWRNMRFDIDSIMLFEKPRATHFGRDVQIDWHILTLSINPESKLWQMLPQHLQFIDWRQVFCGPEITTWEDLFNRFNLVICEVYNHKMFEHDYLYDFKTTLDNHHIKSYPKGTLQIEVTVDDQSSYYLLYEPQSPIHQTKKNGI